ncbi:LysR substrate binding domain-containing protein [Variovorax sp. OV700]|nr:LysR substrate binding domain-containing protein [Variovorax sp. OV700]
MTLKHIEAFRVVVQTGSMTEASRRLHTSQPQVSRLVSQLEAIIGFALFERSGTRLAPSLEGKRFFQEVEKAFAGLQGLESAASNIRTFGGDRLAVAAMARIAGGVLSQAVVRFKREHPETLVTIHSGAATTVDTSVSSGLCDLGLAILYGDDPPGMRVETLLSMDCVALLPGKHRLARAKRGSCVGPRRRSLHLVPAGQRAEGTHRSGVGRRRRQNPNGAGVRPGGLRLFAGRCGSGRERDQSTRGARGAAPSRFRGANLQACHHGAPCAPARTRCASFPACVSLQGSRARRHRIRTGSRSPVPQLKVALVRGSLSRRCPRDT